MEIECPCMNEKLIDAFGGLHEILKLPILEVHPRYNRDYIDYIEYDEVFYPIMRGIDKSDRFFIIFKLQIHYPDKTQNITQVIFQRYSDQNIWTSSSNPPGLHDILGQGDQQYTNIKELILTGKLYNNYNDEICKYILG